jgi:DNA-binding transcriptional MerR regulator
LFLVGFRSANFVNNIVRATRRVRKEHMEGSVQTDEGGAPTTSPAPVQTQVADDTGAEDVKVESETRETEIPESKSSTESEVKLTEKGTKLDPDPLSAAHQQLANERSLRTQYETVLRSPELLKKFAKEAGYTLEEAKEALKEEVYSADKLQTGEDVANALNEIRSMTTKETKTYREQVENLQKELNDLKAGREREALVSKTTSDVTAIRAKYSELNPKDPSYDKELESEIGKMYYKLDFDEGSQRWLGRYSLAEITDFKMSGMTRAKKKGSEEAQTDIKVKERGKVVTSSKPSSGEGAESDDPGTAIAQRIARSFKKS